MSFVVIKVQPVYYTGITRPNKSHRLRRGAAYKLVAKNRIWDRFYKIAERESDNPAEQFEVAREMMRKHFTDPEHTGSDTHFDPEDATAHNQFNGEWYGRCVDRLARWLSIADIREIAR